MKNLKIRFFGINDRDKLLKFRYKESLDGKIISFNEEARKGLERGMNTLADAVKSDAWPKRTKRCP